MRTSVTIILLVFVGVGALAQDKARRTNDVSEMYQRWEEYVGQPEEVTCKPAYYQRASDGFLIPVREARRAKGLRVSGVVLEVVEPRRLVRKMVGFHLDPVEEWDHWYKPDVLYRGITRTRYIGLLDFTCDPRWHAASTNGVSPGAANTLKRFTAADRPISGDPVLSGDNTWAVSCTTTQTFRLFEVPNPGVERCTLTYSARLKTESLVGRAYLEMWCQFPGRGEYFSRGLDNVVTGPNDWATCQTPFILKAGEKPDLIRLNLVVEGRGKVLIKDVALTSAPSK